jgi:dTDP-4-dehydrorhamnose 3,5-epimerase
VAVDIRAGSPTFGKHCALTLSAKDERPGVLWVPAGFAHGFLALEEDSEVQYRCTARWDRASERSLRWDDPDLGIPWPVGEDRPIVSAKDRSGMSLAEYRRSPSFREGDGA